jgi:type II secretory pathway pseudopilin PulG
MRTRQFIPVALALIFTTCATLCAPAIARAQETSASDASTALSAALSAACRANETQFANYLTADNAAAFRALPAAQRTAFVRRFALTDDPGNPLASADAQNHRVLRCEAVKATVEYRFGDARVHENLAFIPVTVLDSERTEFGLIRENGAWRLLSLGLVLLDIPQLAKEWDASDLAAREEAAVQTLRDLAAAIQSYNRAWGKLPESLAALGPAPPGQISPEQAALVNANLAAGKQSGYLFRYRIDPDANGNDTKFELAATPEKYGEVGRRSFFYDSDGKVHGGDKHGAVATPDDPLIAGEKSE